MIINFKKTLPLIYLLSISILFFSCSNDSEENINSLDSWKITSFESSEKKVSALIQDNYFLVPLETNDSSLIVKIEKVILENDRIFVLDPLSPQPVKVFDIQGKHIRNIGRKGGGPGEFNNPIDLFIDGKYVYLYDNPENLLRFDLEGNFVDSQKTGVAGFRIEKNKDKGYVFINGGTEPNLMTTDPSFRNAKSFFPYQNRTVDQLILSPLSKLQDGTVIYRRYLNDTIFSINDQGTPIPHLFIDHEEKAFKPESNMNSDQLEERMAEYAVNQLFLENSDYQMLYFLNSMNPYFSLRNKKNQSTYLINFMNLENDITYTNPLAFTFSTADWFLAAIDPAQLPSDLSNFPEKAKTAMATTTEGDNPVLLFCKFKF
ncbi:MAG: 6-bladed beta-propeller [Cytophagales bacterium]|uniref:6-bladed beta-propeller n=1 Tax=Algoriphagus taiwanensis TaxID=1445656 RepID=A0ABQ6PW83_9BACT|nr:MAG: 6-bladed beta-propeller [Cytophagales bacterium]GMQ32043.1 6-bladed beta-propeller [Algoriphagus taiwanensis]